MVPPPQPRQTHHIRPSMSSAGIQSQHTRNLTGSIGGGISNASPVLLARISEKKAELESLQQLKSLSGQMATQMEALEEKLSTLSGGAEAVALVLSNWHSVLNAISMASAAATKMKDGEGEVSSEGGQPRPLPQTLVRIPMQDMDQAKAKASGGE